MKPSSAIRVPLRAISADGHTIRCHNILESPASVDGVPGLIPVAATQTAIGRNLKPMAGLTLPSGVGCTLLRSPDASVPASLFVQTGSGLTAIGEGLSTPLCAVADGCGWLVMTAGGRLQIESADSSGEEWDIRPLGTQPPDIRLAAVAAGELTGQTPPMTIRDVDFSRDAPYIPESGLDSLSGALLTLYGSLCDRATGNNAWIQPVIARYRLLDSAGNAIFTSEPALMTTDGWQCCETLTAECSKPADGTLAVPPMMLRASMFTIELSVVSLGAYASAADSIEICITPQIHPVETDALPPYRIVRAATASPALAIALPGTTASLADNSAARARDLIRIVARMDAACTRAAAFSTAVDSRHEVRNATQQSFATETALIRRILARNVSSGSEPARSTLLQSVAPQHSFIARSVATAGDAVLWADITTLPGPASLPTTPHTSGNEETEWTGNMRVTMADGTAVDTLIGYPMPMPAGLPPLVSYPDPKAVRIDIWINNIDSSAISHAGVDLTTSEDGSRAISLNPSLKPTPATPWDGTSFPEAPAAGFATGRRYPGALVSARADAPGYPLGALLLTPAPVAAVLPSVKSQSSWDFTRTHFHVFSPAGIFSVGLPADRSRIASSLTDPRGVCSSGLAVFTGSGIVALTDSRQLLRICGSRTTTILDSANAASIGWEATGNSLWLDTPEGLRIISLDTFRHHTRGLPADRADLLSLGPKLWISTTDSLAAAGEKPAASTPVRWSARMAIGKPRRLTYAGFIMAAGRFDGTIRIRTDAGAGAAQSFPILSLKVRGEINAPITARLIGTARGFITIDIEADVSPDFILSEITLY